jgi:hypothetical protein
MSFLVVLALSDDILLEPWQKSGENVSVVDMRSVPEGSPSVNWRLFDMSRASSSDFDAVLGTAEIVHHYSEGINRALNDQPRAQRPTAQCFLFNACAGRVRRSWVGRVKYPMKASFTRRPNRGTKMWIESP